MSANHYWSPTTDSGSFQLLEQATVRGLAFNARSLSQASMGIAAADADGDGDIDFLLTHFSGDHNTYYEQVRPGIWADQSSPVGLAAPSDRMLGYGTQFFDADNQNGPELFVANGDIDDFSHQNRMFRQPVQFFDRASNGRWYQPDRQLIGPYFQSERLARAVVTLDADRDRKTDLLVTHLFDPVSLLVNETATANTQVKIFLHGKAVHRDAIGTRVSAKIGEQEFVQQLLAGDGFQCSNQRCLSFGVDHAGQVEELTVTWPDGSVDRLGTVKPDQDYLILQGSGEAFRLDR